jgi:hypothetical protein
MSAFIAMLIILVFPIYRLNNSLIAEITVHYFSFCILGTKAIFNKSKFLPNPEPTIDKFCCRCPVSNGSLYLAEQSEFDISTDPSEKNT